MNRMLLAGTALCAALVLPAIAEAASGFATANVNMRSGPSTAYPAVTMIPAGQPLRINGCLSETPWCDVSFVGGRGWVAGRYVQAVYQQRRVYVGPDYYRPLGIPTITFDLDNYWDRNYRGRDFYRDRDRWAQQGPDWGQNDGDPNWNRRPPPPPRAYDRQYDDDQGNSWPRRGNWPRQPGYNNDDNVQGDDNPPPRPRYRRPYSDNGQQQDDYAPRQGDYRDDNNPPPRMPRQQDPRQQDQSQPRQQPQGQMQPPPGQPPRQQPQGQPRPPQPAQQQPQPAQPQPQPQPAPPPREQQNNAAPRPADNQPPRNTRGDQSSGPNAPQRDNGQTCIPGTPNCVQPQGREYHR